MTSAPGTGPLPEDWTLPAAEGVHRPWFTAGELVVQRCESCGTRQHPPEEVCWSCGATGFAADPVAPTGTVYSHTVVHHAVHPALEAAVPYAVVLVSLDEAPEVRVVGNLLDVAVGDVAIGMPVVATWVERTAEDGTALRIPQWRRDDGRQRPTGGSSREEGS